MSQPERLQFIDFLNHHYAIRELDFAVLFEQYQSVYLFAYLKEYNVHNINPKLYRNKSAFLNLGFDFRASLKEDLVINDELVMLNFKQIANIDTINQIFYSYKYGKYTGLIVGSNDKQHQLFAIIKYYTSRYFLHDYENFDKTHQQLFFGFLDEILALEFGYILQAFDLQENIKPYLIYAKYSQDQIVHQNSIFHFPFAKPYSDYIHW